jgi:uncharacterized membrane protein YoaK (UPF0700 family)
MEHLHSAPRQRNEEAGMIVFASSVALFVAGAAFGATIVHWYEGSGTAWGPLSVSLLIGVLAAEGLRRALAKPPN